MISNTPEAGEFTPLASYRPREAKKLLQSLDSSGIAFHAEPRRPQRAGYNGPTLVIDVSVDPQHYEQAQQIHIDLFGDSLPNYDSSFFQQHRNV